MSTAYVVLTGYTHSGPPAANGLLAFQAIALDGSGNTVQSPEYGSPVMDTYQIQAGDTSATISAAIASQVQADWGDDTLAVVFVSPGT
jgi:hypothetical protein